MSEADQMLFLEIRSPSQNKRKWNLEMNNQNEVKKIKIKLR
jgi:hypothetical protein